MLDIQFIRDNTDIVKEKSKQKGYDADIDALLRADSERSELIQKIEDLRGERNALNTQAKGQKPSDEAIEKGKQLRLAIEKLEEKLAPVDEKFFRHLRAVPNMPAEDVPVGNSEDQNTVIKTVGQKPKFDFMAKNHWEIGEQHDLIDKKRATKIAGARFAYLKGDLVRLQLALMQFGIETLSNEAVIKKIIKGNNLKLSSKPFVPVLPPAVAKTEVFEATGRLNREEQTYKLADDDLWLNASAEHTLAPMYYDEILDEKDLPIRYVGFTTAFRREAGSYGKDTEGILRLHQFDKLEMESFGTPESSLDEHLFMVAVQEYLMTKLGLPYQVILKCTADIGGPNARGVDINTWMPGQDAYRETHTADYMSDYQARGMKTRVRRADGKVEFVHNNDATAFAMGRTMIAIMENYQTKEGGFRIPEALKPYLK